MKLTLLGTGTPGINPRRRGPGQVIECGNDLILVDCGSGVAHRLVEAGYLRRPVARLAITHLHSDHVSGLADLLWGGWVGQWWDTPPVISGPPGTKDLVNHLLQAFSVDISVRSTHPDGEQLPLEALTPLVEEIQDGWAFESDDWRISAFQVEHPPVVDSFGFRIETEDGALAISGDTRRSENLIRNSQEVDVLVHEVVRLGDTQARTIDDPWARRRREVVNAYHTDSREVGQVATDANARHLVMSHLVLRQGGPANLIDDVRPTYSGEITAGEDLQTFEITRKHGGRPKSGE